MFFDKNKFKALSSILSEAPEDETDGKYSVTTKPPDDEGDNVPSDNPDETDGKYSVTDEQPTNDNPEDTEGKYSIGGDDNTDETDSEIANDDEELPEDDQGEVTDPQGQTEDESVKKLVLLNNFKNLLSINQDLIDSISNYSINISDEDLPRYNYIMNNLLQIKDKIYFLLSKQFEKKNYDDLLKIFMLFKFNLRDLTQLIENLVLTDEKK